MVIFLDIDGVLRPDSAPLYAFHPDCREALESVLRDLPDAKIVITSNWRSGFSLNEIRSHFSPDAANRIVGVTPVSPSSENFTRHREVLAWLSRSASPNEPWIAIDDDPLHYPLGCAVLRIDGAVGFTIEDAKRLRTGAAHLATKSPESSTSSGHPESEE